MDYEQDDHRDPDLDAVSADSETDPSISAAPLPLIDLDRDLGYPLPPAADLASAFLAALDAVDDRRFVTPPPPEEAAPELSAPPVIVPIHASDAHEPETQAPDAHASEAHATVAHADEHGQFALPGVDVVRAPQEEEPATAIAASHDDVRDDDPAQMHLEEVSANQIGEDDQVGEGDQVSEEEIERLAALEAFLAEGAAASPSEEDAYALSEDEEEEIDSELMAEIMAAEAAQESALESEIEASLASGPEPADESPSAFDPSPEFDPTPAFDPAPAFDPTPAFDAGAAFGDAELAADDEDLAAPDFAAAPDYGDFVPEPELAAALDVEVEPPTPEVAAAETLVESMAEAFAEAEPEPEELEDLEDFVVFSLGELRCVVPIRNVIEVGRIPEAAPVPNAPAWLYGLGNLRGQVLSLIDLRAFFGVGRIKAATGRMVVLRGDSDEITAGVMVDQVHQIVSLSPARFHEASVTSVPQQSYPYVWGACDYGNYTMIGLDVDGVLGVESATEETVQAETV